MNRTSGEWFRLFAINAGTILIVLLFAVPLFAQRPPGPPGSPPTDPNDPINQDKANKADMRNREFMMGNSRKTIRRPGWGPGLEAIPQISEDFEKIQVVDKELMTAVFANNLLDNKHIVKATADIEKRATRLIKNLAYPESPEVEKTLAADHERMDIRLALSKLDSAIVSFVTNPIFQRDNKVVTKLTIALSSLERANRISIRS